MGTITINMKQNTPRCPQCSVKDPRFFTKVKVKYRKKDKIDKSKSVQIYKCTECGYTESGEKFGIEETEK